MMRDVSREDHVARFQTAMGQAVGKELRVGMGGLVALRTELIKEEANELIDELNAAYVTISRGKAVSREDVAAILKEMADLQYVLSGLAVTFDLPLQPAFKRVHDSNMSKLNDQGKPDYRADGKVMKGPNYHKPDLLDLVS
jgi:predicted HAD superfamily Cof-like phosphohydrolase